MVGLSITKQTWFLVQRLESDSSEGIYYKLVYRPNMDDELQGRVTFQVTKEEYEASSIGDRIRLTVSPMRSV